MKRLACFVLPLVLLSTALTCQFARSAEPATELAAGLPRVKPQQVGMDAAVLDQIAARIDEELRAGLVSGAVALVAKDGKIAYLTAKGEADIATDRPMAENTLFAVASMTKPITATAVMILQDEGKLKLDDPVSKYIPAFKDAALEGGERPGRAITIRDVLTHTSGLVGDQQCIGTLAETAEMLAKRPLGFQPGTKWQYSPGLNIAGRVVEVASGKAYDAFLAERIFQPLGMNDSTFNPSPEQQKRIARLYKPGDDPHSLAIAEHWINDISAPRTANPSGGLFSTATDMVRFYQAILNGGELDGKRIVSREAVAEMTKLQTSDLMTGFTPGNGWGLGWCIVREPQEATAAVSPGTFGHGGAFGTQGWVDPEKKMIFVLMIQRTGFGNSDASNLRRDFQAAAVKSLGK
jgi:CubicO group peptidase (beta-lactamase class C family)